MSPFDNASNALQKCDRMINTYLYDIQATASSNNAQELRALLADYQQIQSVLATLNIAELEELKEKYTQQYQEVKDEINWRQNNGKITDESRLKLEATLSDLTRDIENSLKKKGYTNINKTADMILFDDEERSPRQLNKIPDPPAKREKKSLLTVAQEIGIGLFGKVSTEQPPLISNTPTISRKPPSLSPTSSLASDTPTLSRKPPSLSPTSFLASDTPTLSRKPPSLSPTSFLASDTPTINREPPSLSPTSPTQNKLSDNTDLPSPMLSEIDIPEHLDTAQTNRAESADLTSKSNSNRPTRVMPPPKPKPKHARHPLTHQPIKKPPSTLSNQNISEEDQESDEDIIASDETVQAEDTTKPSDSVVVKSQKNTPNQVTTSTKSTGSGAKQKNSVDDEELLEEGEPITNMTPEELVQAKLRDYMKKHPKVNWQDRDRQYREQDKQRFAKELQDRQSYKPKKKETKALPILPILDLPPESDNSKKKSWWPFS